ncbi:MAG: hypothetical protein WC763_02045 [Candidatus Paceibacterota bacterium]|jgi:hypothetical protein
MKKINRNAFNEKLIHRYLFERYYFAPKDIRNKLLPAEYHKDSINLIAPEDSGEKEGYRADLTIFFKDKEQGVPVEVKWFGKGLTKQNQIDYLLKHNGFIVSFGDVEEGLPVKHIVIDPNDFLEWTQFNISKLTRESLIYQAGIKTLGSSQHWVVFLRGTSHENFFKMLRHSKRSPFWAYKQNEHALRNILNIQQGDSVLFILGYASEGMGMSNNPNLKLQIRAWYEVIVKDPYYMILKGDKGTFFESGDIPVNKRRWPHFVDFEIRDSFEWPSRVEFGKRGEYASAFAESVNYGSGAPAPLLRAQYEHLADSLRKISK